MHHTIITIDIATIGRLHPSDVAALLRQWDADLDNGELALEDWKVRVHQEHNGVITPVPGYTTPQGERV